MSQEAEEGPQRERFLSPPPVPAVEKGKGRAHQQEPPARSGRARWRDKEFMLEQAATLLPAEKHESFADRMAEVQSLYFASFADTSLPSSSKVKRPFTLIERHLKEEYRVTSGQMIDNASDVYTSVAVDAIANHVRNGGGSLFVPASDDSHVLRSKNEINGETGVEDELMHSLRYLCKVANILRFRQPALDGLHEALAISCTHGTSPLGMAGATHDVEIGLAATDDVLESEIARGSEVDPKRRVLLAGRYLAKPRKDGGRGGKFVVGDVKGLRTDDAASHKTWIEFERLLAKGYEPDYWPKGSNLAPAQDPSDSDEPIEGFPLPGQDGTRLEASNPLVGSTPCRHHFNVFRESTTVPAVPPVGHKHPLETLDRDDRKRARVSSAFIPPLTHPSSRFSPRLANAPSPSSSGAPFTAFNSPATAKPKSLCELAMQPIFQSIYHRTKALFFTCGTYFYFGIRDGKSGYFSPVEVTHGRRHGQGNSDELLDFMLPLLGFLLWALDHALAQADCDLQAHEVSGDGHGGGDDEEMEDGVDGGKNLPEKGKDKESDGPGASLDPDLVAKSFARAGVRLKLKYDIFDTPHPPHFAPKPSYEHEDGLWTFQTPFTPLDLVAQGTVPLSDSDEHLVVAGELLRGHDLAPQSFPAMIKLFLKDTPRQAAEFSAYEKLSGVKGVPRAYASLICEDDDQALLLLSKEGKSLSELRRGLTTVEEAQLQEALASIHARGLVHGDISERNILVEGPNGPCIVDFDTSTSRDEVIDEEAFAAMMNEDVAALQALLAALF